MIDDTPIGVGGLDYETAWQRDAAYQAWREGQASTRMLGGALIYCAVLIVAAGLALRWYLLGSPW